MSSREKARTTAAKMNPASRIGLLDVPADLVIDGYSGVKLPTRKESK